MYQSGIARRLLVLLQSLVLGHLARTGANSCSDSHFEAKVNVSVGDAWLGAVVVEDFDGDGVPDIASVRKGSSTITWFRNLLRQSGGGGVGGVNNVTFQNPGSVVAETGGHKKYTRSIVAGDFDGDGFADIAAHTHNGVVWYRNPHNLTHNLTMVKRDGFGAGAPVWRSETVTTTCHKSESTSSLAAIDANKDGNVDLVAACVHEDRNERDRIVLYLNINASSWVEINVSSSVINPYSVAVGDFDGDGRTDIASVCSEYCVVNVHRNADDSGMRWDNEKTPVFRSDDEKCNSAVVMACDINSDGWLDLVTGTPNEDLIQWHKNEGRNEHDGHDGDTSDPQAAITMPWPSYTISRNARGVYSLACADFNGDGALDVASALSFSGQVQWYPNANGFGHQWLDPITVDTNMPHTRSVVVGDLNLDGWPDLAASHSQGHPGKVNLFVNEHGASRCCPGGTFRVIIASSSSCTGRCSTGKYSEWPSVEDKCFSCPQGYMSTRLPGVIYTGKGCDACPKGRYQDAPGQTSCKDCGLWLWQHYTTSTIATTSYKDCTPALNSPVLILLIIIPAVIVAVVSGRFCYKWLTRRHERHALGVSLLHGTEMAEMLLGWCIQSSEVDYEKIIGRGAFGEVWLGRWKGADVAIKKIFPSPMEMAEYELQQSGRRGNRRSGSSGSRSRGSQSSQGSIMDPLAASMLSNLEVETMTKLRHPRVVTFFGAGEIDEGAVCVPADGTPAPPKGIFVVLEFVAGGDLQQVLERALGNSTLNDGTTALPWQVRLQYALDIAEGMAFIHSKDLIHRDLKSLNVLVDHDGRCKIADLGLVRRSRMNIDSPLRSPRNTPSKSTLSRFFRGAQDGEKKSAGRGGSGSGDSGGRDSGSDSATKLQGTLQWMAPEVLDGGYDRKVDVYSFGIVMWEILTCRIPWEDDDRIRFSNYVLVAVSEGQRPVATEKELQQAPREFVELMRACWAGLPSARPTFVTVLERLRRLAETLPLLSLQGYRHTEDVARLEQEITTLDAEMRRCAAALNFVAAERCKIKLAALLRRHPNPPPTLRPGVV